MSCSCRDLDVQAVRETANRTTSALSGIRQKCKAFNDLQSMNRRDPKFQKTLEAGMSHPKSATKIYHWQSEQDGCFLHEDPHHSWSHSTKAMRTLESVFGARVTWRNLVEEIAPSVTNPEMLPISFATSVLQGLRRTLEEVTGAVDNAEAGPTVEEECPVQKLAYKSGQTSYDEATRLCHT